MNVTLILDSWLAADPRALAEASRMSLDEWDARRSSLGSIDRIHP
jgi:hypothetical protein